MKKTLTFASVVIGALLGASALSVLAQTSGSWTAPTVAPPGGNVAAPLNIGTTLQEKLGSLLIDGNLGVLGNLVIATGTPSAGKVLTALNNTGLVAWGDASASGGASTGTGGCNTVNIPPSASNQAANLSLLINGTNICTTSGGCNVRMWRYSATDPAGNIGYDAVVRQISTGHWDRTTSGGDTQGINGNSTADLIASPMSGGKLYDDSPTGLTYLSGSATENSSDKWTLQQTDSSNGYIASVCAFGGGSSSGSGGIGSIVIRVATTTVPNGNDQQATALCAANEQLISGGCGFWSSGTQFKNGSPNSSGTGWNCSQYASGPGYQGIFLTNAYALCATGSGTSVSLPSCSNGQIMKMVSGAWSCADAPVALSGTAVVSFVNGQSHSSLAHVTFPASCSTPRVLTQSATGSIACGTGSAAAACTAYNGTASQDLISYPSNITTSGFDVSLSGMSGAWVGASSPAFNIYWMATCN